MPSQYIDLPVEGSSAGVSSINLETGAITLAAGTGISIADSPPGTFTISATGTSLIFADSLVNTAGTVTLVNDNATPGDSYYYGTNSSGTKGFFTLPSPTSYTFADSIVNTGGTVTLVGDTASPTASQYYGTDSGATLGFFNLPSPTSYSFSDSLVNTSGTVTLVNDSASPTTAQYYGTGPSPSTTLGYYDLPVYGAQWKASVSTASALPSIGNTLSDVRVTDDTSVLYVWNGSAWVAEDGLLGVTSLNSLTGSLSIVAGTGISVTPSGSNITIASTVTNYWTESSSTLFPTNPDRVLIGSPTDDTSSILQIAGVEHISEQLGPIVDITANATGSSYNTTITGDGSSTVNTLLTNAGGNWTATIGGSVVINNGYNIVISGGTDLTAASTTIYDSQSIGYITYTAVTPGSAGNSIEIIYQAGADGGSETVNVVGTQITVTMNPNATQDAYLYEQGNFWTSALGLPYINGNSINIVYQTAAITEGSETASLTGSYPNYVVTVTICDGSLGTSNDVDVYNAVFAASITSFVNIYNQDGGATSQVADNQFLSHGNDQSSTTDIYNAVQASGPALALVSQTYSDWGYNTFIADQFLSGGHDVSYASFSGTVNNIYPTLIMDSSSALIQFNGKIWDGTNTIIDVGSKLLYNSSGVETVNWNAGYLISSYFSVTTVNWNSPTLFDYSGNESIYWGNRVALDSYGAYSIEWDSRTLNDTYGNTVVDWGGYTLTSDGGSQINWGIGWLIDGSGYGSVQWNSYILHDGSDFLSQNWDSRILYANDGSTSQVNYSNPAVSVLVNYVAANPSFWSGSPPTDLASAIERIAAVVSAGGTVPIP